MDEEKEEKSLGHFGTNLGDLGVIAIAAVFSLCGFYLMYLMANPAAFTLPAPAHQTAPAHSHRQNSNPTGETIILLGAPAKKP